MGTEAGIDMQLGGRPGTRTEGSRTMAVFTSDCI
jgi:hypothetical protein